MQEEHGTTDHGKKAKPVWTHIQDKEVILERGEEDHAANGRMTSRSGVEKIFTFSTGRRRIKERGERRCGRHWTPTGGEPMEQWMDGGIDVYRMVPLTCSSYEACAVCRTCLIASENVE